MITTATILSGIAQGLIWAILTLGVYLTFRILDIADLTVEGTFPLGAAVTVVLINTGMSPALAMLCAVLAGAAAGFVTGFLHTIFQIPAILSGILTMIALYSVNIRIMSDKATVALEQPSIKTWMLSLLPEGTVSNTVSIILGTVFCLLIVALLYYFFGTEIGCAVRATGSNQHMARSLGVKTDRIIILGLMISNALVALSGSLIAQLDYGSALVTMGQGTIVIGSGVRHHRRSHLHPQGYELCAEAFGNHCRCGHLPYRHRLCADLQLPQGDRPQDHYRCHRRLCPRAAGTPAKIRRAQAAPRKREEIRCAHHAGVRRRDSCLE